MRNDAFRVIRWGRVRGTLVRRNLSVVSQVWPAGRSALPWCIWILALSGSVMTISASPDEEDKAQGVRSLFKDTQGINPQMGVRPICNLPVQGSSCCPTLTHSVGWLGWGLGGWRDRKITVPWFFLQLSSGSSL